MKRFVLILAVLITTQFLFSQTADNPWKFSLGINIVDTYPTGETENALGETGTLFESFLDVGGHWNVGGPSIEISRYISSGISLGLQGGVNSISKIQGLANVTYPYFNSDLFASFNPFENKKLSPFLKLGYGLSSFGINTNLDSSFLSKNISKTIFYGLGLNYAITEDFGISIQSSYRNSYERYSPIHFQHQVGMYYSLSSSDTDNDGVPDKKDACPEVPGLKEFDGCPDTDGDSIIDKEDNCPEEAGLAEFQGCPDTDGDGVPDPDDSCPTIPGLKALNGCLDTDSDGISDDKDKCVERAGPIENEGCPWPDKDADGIPDKDDLCPEEKGTSENNGCPELSSEIIETINQFGSKIFFPANSSRILGRKTKEVLDQIKKILMENPNGTLIIEGYTSADGNEDYNIDLSVRRAEAVLDYLIGLGVSPNRLEVQGYGEEAPLEDNSNPKGRAKNRRVQFKAKRN
jgi:OmpA-OmpF porin, OOP family